MRLLRLKDLLCEPLRRRKARAMAERTTLVSFQLSFFVFTKVQFIAFLNVISVRAKFTHSHKNVCIHISQKTLQMVVRNWNDRVLVRTSSWGLVCITKVHDG